MIPNGVKGMINDFGKEVKIKIENLVKQLIWFTSSTGPYLPSRSKGINRTSYIDDYRSN